MITETNKKNKGEKGFTLIEMIVSIGLFTVVMFVAIGSLTSIATAGKKVQATRIVMDNLNFAVESMARSMRLGRDYHCGTSGVLTEPNNCPTVGSDSMAFQSVDTHTFVFRLNNGRLQKSENGGSTFLDMTAPEIEIDNLQFFIRGALSGDGEQPRVLIIIQGTAGVKDKEKTTFNLQTTVSQRAINI